MHLYSYIYIGSVLGMELMTRKTPATAAVLEIMLSATDAVWGLQVVKETGLKTGTVYPILERLEAAGWVEGAWDADDERKGPRRRYFHLTAEAEPYARQYVESQHAKANPGRSIALGFGWITA